MKLQYQKNYRQQRLPPVVRLYVLLEQQLQRRHAARHRQRIWGDELRLRGRRTYARPADGFRRSDQCPEPPHRKRELHHLDDAARQHFNYLNTSGQQVSNLTNASICVPIAAATSGTNTSLPAIARRATSSSAKAASAARQPALFRPQPLRNRRDAGEYAGVPSRRDLQTDVLGQSGADQRRDADLHRRFVG